jgi:hypothetical protein
MRIIENIVFATVILSLFFLFSCSSTLQIKTEVDEEVDFSKYSTFNFYQIKEENEKMNPVNKQRILVAIEQELGRKGIKLSNEPELIVNIFTLLRRREGYAVHNPGGMGMYGGYYGMYGGGFGVSYSSPSTSYVPGSSSGEFIIDLVDRQRMELVLQAIVYSQNEEGSKDDQRRIDYAVKKIFQKIPDKK